MEELLGLVKIIYAQAPAPTRWVAQISLLFGLLGLGIACARAVYLTLAKRNLKRILGGLHGAPPGSDAVGEWKDLDDAWNEILGLRVPRAFRDTLQRMDRARTRPVGLPEEAWRGAYEHVLGEESRWETLVRGIASAAVLVGLLGTVVGFADISGELALVPGAALVQSAPAEKATSKTAAALGSKLGGVFISTISGIFASLLILLVGAPILRSAADQWLSVVEDVGRLVIVPALPRPSPRIQDALVEELQRRISTVAIAWESWLRGPAASLAEVAENSRRSVEAAVQAFDGLRVSVEDLKELGRSAKRIREAAQSIEGTAKVYVTASNRLGAAVGSLEATLPALSTDLKSLADRLAGLEGVLASGTRSVTESGDALQNAVSKMGGDFHGLQEAVASRHERESSFLQHTEQAVRLIEERLKGLEVVEQEIKAQAKEMILAVVSMGAAVGTALEPLSHTIERAIRETFGKLLTDHESVLLVTIAETAKLLDKICLAEAGLLNAREEVAASAKILTERGEGLGRAAEGASSLVSSVLNRLSDAVDQLARLSVVSGPRSMRAPVENQGDGGTGGPPPSGVGITKPIGASIHGVPLPLDSPLLKPGDRPKEVAAPAPGPPPPWATSWPPKPTRKTVPQRQGIWARVKRYLGLG